MVVSEKPVARPRTRDGWRTVRFGDVVRNVDVAERDPLSKGLERVVGLEHIEPGSLHIREWGDIADGTSFSRTFRVGQVLFGKRRAYQRKVACAEFNGICSGDILVFEAVGEELLPELLPFIVQSEPFFEHALQTSAGSLSPRTKWTELAKYEFALPPKDEQRRIAEILWAADAATVAMEDALDGGASLREALVAESLRAAIANDEVTTLSAIASKPQYGTSAPSSRSTRVGVPVVGIPSVTSGYLDLSEAGWATFTGAEIEKYELRRGDVLVVRTNGNPDYVGRAIVVPELSETVLFASYLIRLQPANGLNPSYLCHFLNSGIARRELRKQIRSSAGNYNLSVPGLTRQTLPLPSRAAQQALVDAVSEINRDMAAAAAHKAMTRSTVGQLREHLLGGC